jgi:hypothetical protein
VSEQSQDQGVLVSPSDVPLDLADALSGVRLSQADVETVKWMKRQSNTRISAVVSILEKVRQAGYTEGYNDARDDLRPDKPHAASPFPDPA